MRRSEEVKMPVNVEFADEGIGEWQGDVRGSAITATIISQAQGPFVRDRRAQKAFLYPIDARSIPPLSTIQ